jgi:hypothetical protein
MYWAATTPISSTAPQVAHCRHAPVRVHHEAAGQPVRVCLHGRDDHLVGRVDRHQTALDAEAVHLVQQRGSAVGGPWHARRVVEHVPGRMLEVLATLVVQHRLERLVPAAPVGTGQADHRVDHADVRGHAHGADRSKRLLGRP